MTLSQQIMSLNPHDAYCRLRPLRPDDSMRRHFTEAQWSYMTPLSGDPEFYQWMSELPDIGAAFVYTTTDTDTPLALCYVVVENTRRRIITFHGGGWHSPMANYRCARLIVKTLKNAGWDVRTRVSCSNTRACRFVTSLGFRRYRTKDSNRLYKLSQP